MDALITVLALDVVGGLVLALLIAVTMQHTPSAVVSRRLPAPSPAMINMAHIQVEGAGGLGLVAAAVAVALWDPGIRLAVVVALALGSGFALVLIAMRHRSGALPSGGGDPRDRSTLALEGRHGTGLAGLPITGRR